MSKIKVTKTTKVNGTPTWQQIRKEFAKALPGQKAKNKDEALVVRYILWSNFLNNDHTRVLQAAVCQGVEWAKLKRNEWVLFLNLDLSRASLIRLTPSGNIMGIHAELKSDSEASLIDLAAAMGEQDLRIWLDRRKAPTSISKLGMRKQDLVLFLERSRANMLGWSNNDVLLRKALIQIQRRKAA